MKEKTKLLQEDRFTITSGSLIRQESICKTCRNKAIVCKLVPDQTERSKRISENKCEFYEKITE